MSLSYKDFFPAVLKSGLFSTQHEAFSETVARADKWLEDSGVSLVNVETVVLPNVDCEKDASKEAIRTSGEMSSYWYQIVRVWYQAPPST